MTFNKFLAIAFMCHQRPDRSFFINDKQLPLCARCTGILLGYILGITIAIITSCRHSVYFLLCLIPMIIDGGIQHLFGIISNNWRRLFTGILGGVGIIYCFINIHLLTVMMATALLKHMNII